MAKRKINAAMILAASESKHTKNKDTDTMPFMDMEEAEDSKYLYVPGCTYETPKKKVNILKEYEKMLMEEEKYYASSLNDKDSSFPKRQKEITIKTLEYIRKTMEDNISKSSTKYGSIRIDLNSTTFSYFFRVLIDSIERDCFDMFTFKDVIKSARFVPKSYKKSAATENANAAKISKSRAKVQNAINLLRLEGKDITPYAVAKVANISYNTAKKYIYKDKK